MLLKKDVLKVAKYRPNPADPDFVVDVTPEVLDHWSRTFHDMKNATDPNTGESFPIKLPVPWEHPPKGDENADPLEWSARKDGDPRVNAGWVEDVYREGDTLYAVLDVKDEYADDLQKSGCYVSPKFGGTWTDSLDRVWQNPIHHIALTTKPVAVNQTKNFRPVESPALAFSRAMCFSTSQWSQTEEPAVPDLSPEEAVDRLFENPNFVELARQRLSGMPEQQFSAPSQPGMPGMPPGMPQGAPTDMGQEPDVDEGGDQDMATVCMQILHEVSQAVAGGMKALAQFHGVSMGDDEDTPMAPAQPAPAPQVDATPATVSMSRTESEKDQLIAALSHKATASDRSSLTSRANALYESARCTKPQLDEMLSEIGKYEFSRQKETPNLLLIERIKTLESLPEHAAIPVANKDIEFSRKANATQPNAAFNSGEEMTDERADEIVKANFGF